MKRELTRKEKKENFVVKKTFNIEIDECDDERRNVKKKNEKDEKFYHCSFKLINRFKENTC